MERPTISHADEACHALDLVDAQSDTRRPRDELLAYAQVHATLYLADVLGDVREELEVIARRLA